MMYSKEQLRGGERLKEICTRKELSLNELAERIGYDTAQLYNITAAKSTRNISKNMAQEIKRVFPDIRLEYLLGVDEYMTQENVDDVFESAWNETVETDTSADPFLSCLGYSIKPEVIETPDASPWGTCHREDDIIPPECIAWHSTGKYEIWHNGSKIVDGCTENEIEQLKQEIHDIFDYANMRVQRLVSSRKGGNNG